MESPPAVTSGYGGKDEEDEEPEEEDGNDKEKEEEEEGSPRCVTRAPVAAPGWGEEAEDLAECDDEDEDEWGRDPGSPGSGEGDGAGGRHCWVTLPVPPWRRGRGPLLSSVLGSTWGVRSPPTPRGPGNSRSHWPWARVLSSSSSLEPVPSPELAAPPVEPAAS